MCDHRFCDLFSFKLTSSIHRFSRLYTNLVTSTPLLEWFDWRVTWLSRDLSDPLLDRLCHEWPLTWLTFGLTDSWIGLTMARLIRGLTDSWLYRLLGWLTLDMTDLWLDLWLHPDEYFHHCHHLHRPAACSHREEQWWWSKPLTMFFQDKGWSWATWEQSRV